MLEKYPLKQAEKQLFKVIEPHNPRTTPTKAVMNIASAILGVVYILLFS